VLHLMSSGFGSILFETDCKVYVQCDRCQVALTTKFSCAWRRRALALAKVRPRSGIRCNALLPIISKPYGNHAVAHEYRADCCCDKNNTHNPIPSANHSPLQALNEFPGPMSLLRNSTEKNQKTESKYRPEQARGTRNSKKFLFMGLGANKDCANYNKTNQSQGHRWEAKELNRIRYLLEHIDHEQRG